jgi:putative transposase
MIELSISSPEFRPYRPVGFIESFTLPGASPRAITLWAFSPADKNHRGLAARQRTARNSYAMSQSLANIVVHLVFSPKGRRQLLRVEERGQLHAYITGILKNHDSPLIEINSVRDHIHILFAQSKNHAPAKIVEQVKSSSSGWIKEPHAWYADFAWQTGYGEFSVSPMHVELVREYIRNQPEHHKQEDFQTEYRRFCEKNGKPLDERYAWD